MPHYNLPHNHGQNIERVLDNMPSAEGFQDIRLLNKRVVRAYYLLDDDYNSISYDLFLALAG